MGNGWAKPGKIEQRGLLGYFYQTLDNRTTFDHYCWCKTMAFAVHINMERCTGCNNCVVACPVGALELFTEDPVTNEKIYRVKDGKALVLDFRAEALRRLRRLCRGLSLRRDQAGRQPATRRGRCIVIIRCERVLLWQCQRCFRSSQRRGKGTTWSWSRGSCRPRTTWSSMSRNAPGAASALRPARRKRSPSVSWAQRSAARSTSPRSTWTRRSARTAASASASARSRP